MLHTKAMKRFDKFPPIKALVQVGRNYFNPLGSVRPSRGNYFELFALITQQPTGQPRPGPSYNFAAIIRAVPVHPLRAPPPPPPVAQRSTNRPSVAPYRLSISNDRKPCADHRPVPAVMNADGIVSNVEAEFNSGQRYHYVRILARLSCK